MHSKMPVSHAWIGDKTSNQMEYTPRPDKMEPILFLVLDISRTALNSDVVFCDNSGQQKTDTKIRKKNENAPQ